MINKFLSFPYVRQLERERNEALAGDLTLSKLVIENGKMDATFHDKFTRLLATWCAEVIGDAENYVEITCKNKDSNEIFCLTARRERGKTPHQLRREAEQELAELKAAIAKKPKADTIRAKLINGDLHLVTSLFVRENYRQNTELDPFCVVITTHKGEEISVFAGNHESCLNLQQRLTEQIKNGKSFLDIKDTIAAFQKQ